MSVQPTFALTDDGTAVASPLRLVSGLQATVVRIRTCMQVYIGDWPDDALYGVVTRRWSEPGVQPVELEAVLRQQLSQLQGVLEVVRVTVLRVGGAWLAQATARIMGDDEEAVAVVGDIAETALPYPGAWYLLIQGVQPIIPVM